VKALVKITYAGKPAFPGPSGWSPDRRDLRYDGRIGLADLSDEASQWAFSGQFVPVFVGDEWVSVERTYIDVVQEQR
jgi:hypothetical protein